MDSLPAPATVDTAEPVSESAEPTPAKSAPPPIKPATIWQEPARSYVLSEKYKRLLVAIKKWAALTYIRDKRRILSPYEMRQAMDPVETGRLAEAHLARHSATLESWRNVLVVLPLLLTWLSLGLAAAAYQQSVALVKAGQPIPPFFQAWQEGFPSLTVLKVWSARIPLLFRHSHYLTFTDVALVDCVILITLLLLTGISQWMAISAHRHANRLQIWLEEQIFELSKESITWSLNPADQDKPRWAAEVQFTLNAVTDALGKVSGAVGDFEASLARQGSIVGGIVDDASDVTRGVAELTTFYQLVVESYRNLEGVLPDVSKHLATLAATELVTADEWKHMAGNLDYAVRSIAAVGDAIRGTNMLDGVRNMQETYQSPRSRGLSQRLASAWAGLRGR